MVPGTAHQADEVAQRQERILDVIHQLEASGRVGDDVPRGACGELGPLQISRSYWEDAEASDRVLGLGSYEQCRSLDFSKAVVRAYMRRYVPEAWARADAEVILRTHNGGPRGKSKDSTLPYWERGRRLLDQ